MKEEIERKRIVIFLKKKKEIRNKTIIVKNKSIN